ncbi:hypothetical protein [Amycolatopsis sp. NPDC058986]|uniref:hypothetical protein n=1 Tax=unclassified Amycolatopsis TaxID=2618356 RepID=UPI00366AD210
MTYPPQPGASPQPGGWDPGTPPSPYPQQQSHWDPNAPQGGYPGPPPEPPRKNRTGLWIAVAVAVVVVIALSVTGFVAPGFFLGKNESSAAPPASTSSATGAPGLPSGMPVPPSRPGTGAPPPAKSSEGPAPAGGRQLVETVLAKLNAKDAAGANALVCPGMEELVKDAVTRATTGDPRLTAEEPTGSEDTALTQLGGTLDGKKAAGFITAGNVGGNWCVAGLFVFA